MRRQTPTYACVVEQAVRQPPVFIAPPLPAPAQVVILARALMGPHSTRSIALVGQRHVILSMACTATHPTVNARLWSTVVLDLSVLQGFAMLVLMEQVLTLVWQAGTNQELNVLVSFFFCALVKFSCLSK